jgi:Flp pilus assembly pilin Flp
VLDLYAKLQTRLAQEGGQTITEYAVVLAVIAIGIFVTLGILSGAISGALSSVASQIWESTRYSNRGLAPAGPRCVTARTGTPVTARAGAATARDLHTSAFCHLRMTSCCLSKTRKTSGTAPRLNRRYWPVPPRSFASSAHGLPRWLPGRPAGISLVQIVAARVNWEEF